MVCSMHKELLHILVAIQHMHRLMIELGCLSSISEPDQVLSYQRKFANLFIFALSGAQAVTITGASGTYGIQVI